MKTKRWLVTAASAVLLCIGTSQTLGQNSQGWSGGNYDHGRSQDSLMDRLKERLEFTNDAEWQAIGPLVQKVVDLQRQAMSDRLRGFFGRQGGSRYNDSAPMPEAETLQRAIEGKASHSELKLVIAKYLEARKARQAELERAQAELRKVLTLRQEAIATASGLL